MKVAKSNWFDNKLRLLISYNCDCHCGKCWWECNTHEGVDDGYRYFDVCYSCPTDFLTFAIGRYCNHCGAYCKKSKSRTFPVANYQMHFIDMTKDSLEFAKSFLINSIQNFGGNSINSSYQNESSTSQVIRVLSPFLSVYTNALNGTSINGMVPDVVVTQRVLNIEIPAGGMYIQALEDSDTPTYEIPLADWSDDDSDLDGLTCDQEDTLGTCDSHPDSDNDGLNDKSEVDGTSLTIQVLGKVQKHVIAKPIPLFLTAIGMATRMVRKY